MDAFTGPTQRPLDQPVGAPSPQTTKRRGRWTYGVHPDIPGDNAGWRLDGTNLVLDFDPLDRGGDLRGGYVLYDNGRYVDRIDHYVDPAMSWVERNHPEAVSAR